MFSAEISDKLNHFNNLHSLKLCSKLYIFLKYMLIKLVHRYFFIYIF